MLGNLANWTQEHEPDIVLTSSLDASSVKCYKIIFELLSRPLAEMLRHESQLTLPFSGPAIKLVLHALMYTALPNRPVVAAAQENLAWDDDEKDDKEDVRKEACLFAYWCELEEVTDLIFRDLCLYPPPRGLFDLAQKINRLPLFMKYTRPNSRSFQESDKKNLPFLLDLVTRHQCVSSDYAEEVLGDLGKRLGITKTKREGFSFENEVAAQMRDLAQLYTLKSPEEENNVLGTTTLENDVMVITRYSHHMEIEHGSLAMYYEKPVVAIEGRNHPIVLMREDTRLYWRVECELNARFCVDFTWPTATFLIARAVAGRGRFDDIDNPEFLLDAFHSDYLAAEALISRPEPEIIARALVLAGPQQSMQVLRCLACELNAKDLRPIVLENLSLLFSKVNDKCTACTVMNDVFCTP